jgi:hypothetical protein
VDDSVNQTASQSVAPGAETVTADEIAAGDHILVRNAGQTFPARVASLARYHAAPGNMRTFWWTTAAGRAGEITCADASEITRVPAPPLPPRPVLPEVGEDILSLADELSAFAATMRVTGLPFPSRVYYMIPGSVTEADARAFIAGKAEACRACGVRFELVATDFKLGIIIRLGGGILAYHLTYLRQPARVRSVPELVPAAA